MTDRFPMRNAKARIAANSRTKTFDPDAVTEAHRDLSAGHVERVIRFAASRPVPPDAARWAVLADLCRELADDRAATSATDAP